MFFFNMIKCDFMVSIQVYFEKILGSNLIQMKTYLLEN
jgi:hypothetical protein